MSRRALEIAFGSSLRGLVALRFLLLVVLAPRWRDEELMSRMAKPVARPAPDARVGRHGGAWL